MKKSFQVCLASGIAITVLFLLILFVPNNITLSASATEYYYGNLTYEIRSGYVGGTYYSSYAEITRCSTSAKGDVVIPETIDSYTVISIRSRAFENCSKIESVNLGTVKYLGEYLFAGCSSLTKIHIPSSVTTATNALQNSSIELISFDDDTTLIPAYIANGCTSLKTIAWPQNVNGFRIDQYAFSYSSIKNLELPTNLTYISNYSFLGCALITDLTIPDSVTYIGEFTFGDCSRLTSLYVGTGTTTIDKYAFSGCYTLANVHLGNRLSKIGEYAFKNCKQITELSMPDSVRTIDRYAFESCTKLSSINLGKVVTLGDYVFSGCTSLTNLIIPNTVTSTNRVLQYSSVQSLTFDEGIPHIPAYIACGCTTLTEMSLPEKGTSLSGYSIGQYAFSSTSLTTIVLPNGLTQIDQYAFSYCGLLTEIEIPSTLVTIGKYSFVGCNRLTELHLTDSVTWIGSYAFSGCNKLSEVTFGNSLETINEFAFENCSKLTSLELPSSTVNIYRYAFANCSSLSSIDLGKVVTLGDYVFSGCTSLTNLTIPNTVTSTNRVLQYSSVQSLAFDEGIPHIPAYIAYNCGTLIEVSLPEKEVTLSGYSIGEYAFYGTSIGMIALPDSLGSISNYAFGYCTLLTKLVLPQNLKTVGEYAFYNCSTLRSIQTDDKLETIGRYAFAKCSNLSEIDLGQGLITINEYAFQNCSGLTSIFCPDSLKTIGKCAFENCVNLSNIQLAKINTLGDFAFSGCYELKELVIPQTITSSNKVLQYSSVKKLSFEKGIKHIPAYIAYNCSSLTDVILPEKNLNVNGYAIGEYAFYQCTNLKRINIPTSLTAINRQAFEGCTSMDSIRLPNGIALDATAFTNARISDLQIPTEDSQIALILIDNQVKFTADKKGILDSSTRYLRRDKTAYYKAQTTVSSAGSIPLVIEYDFKDDYKSSITNVSFTIRIPTATQLKRNSVMVNGETVTYSERNGYITFSVNSSSGRITLNVIPNNSDYLTTYAKVSYSYKGVNRTETIGIVDMRSNLLTMIVPEEVSSRALPISGVSSPLAAITIWVDDVEVGTCTANALGNYTSTVFLEGIAKEKIYKIKVQATATDNTTNSVVDYVTYNEEAIKLTEFTMYYRNAEYDLIELQASSPVISWTSDSTFTFVCSFNYNDRIEKVRVVSIKDNDTRAIDAYYDAEINAFVASGFTGYVPGILTVEFIEKNDNPFESSKITIGDTYNNNGNIGFPMIVDVDNKGQGFVYYFREFVATTTIDFNKALQHTVLDGYDCYMTTDPYVIYKNNIYYICYDFYIRQDDNTFAMFRQGIGSSLYVSVPMRRIAPREVVDTIIEIIEPEEKFVLIGDTLHTLGKLIKENNSGKNNSQDIYIHLKQFIKYAKETLEPNSRELNEIRAIEPYIEIYGSTATLGQVMNTLSSLPEYEHIVPYGPDEWMEMVAENIASEKIEQIFDEMQTVTDQISNKQLKFIMDKLSGSETYLFWEKDSLMEKVINKALKDYESYLATNAEFGAQYSEIRATSRWGIDPSGYAYEAVESNRLSGVKVTIYYRKNMESDPVEWDASEYDQKNPLYTDEDGCYSWDVPEGLWQVKFEMNGYETTYSEWLPVPPPQLDVNIGLVSTSLPQIAYVNAYTDEIELIFTQFMDIDSVINGNVQFKHNGQVLDGFWNPQAVQKNETEKSVSYAKVFRFVLKDKINGSVTVSVSNVCNYAGNVMDGSYGMECVVNHRITSIDVPSSVQVGYKNSSVISVQVFPANTVAGKKLIVNTNNRFIISVNNDIFFDENGVAYIEVSSLLPGEATLQYMIEGTTHMGSIGIASTNYNIETDVINIQIDTLPKQTEYHKGEKFDQTGLILRVEYIDGTSTLITTGFTCSPLSLDTVGAQTVTVKYGKQTASFEIKVLDSQYTCSWNNNGQITQTVVNIGDSIIPPLSPIKDGFTFIGWSPAIPESMPAENLSFTALFTKNDTEATEYHSITWVIDEVEVVSMYPFGAVITAPSTPHKDGYIFVEWSPTIPTTMPDQNLCITAVFVLDSETPTTIPSVHIIAPPIDTMEYKDTIVLYADIQNLPTGCRVVWEIDNTNFSLAVAEDGLSCVLEAQENGSATVTVKVVDKNGDFLTYSDGELLHDNQLLVSQVSFWDKHGRIMGIVIVILLIIPYVVFVAYYILKKRKTQYVK